MVISKLNSQHLIFKVFHMCESIEKIPLEENNTLLRHIINPYPADKYFDQIEWLPTLTKVLISNFFGTLPTVTNVTEVTFS